MTGSIDRQPSKKIDFRKKGLGWIPDYPDMRDYTLEGDKVHTEGRLKRSELTGTIENLADSLLEALRVLRYEVKRDNNQITELDQRIDNLENQVFGNIYFVTMNARKLLREKVDKPDSPIVVKRFLQESYFSKQINQLKQYLGILFLKGELKAFSFSQSDKDYLLEKPELLALGESLKERIERVEDFCKKNTIHFKDDSRQIVDWLRSEEFDEITKQLVMLFQCRTNLLVDGVVGLVTYTALNEHFLNSGNASYINDHEDCEEYCKDLVLERQPENHEGTKEISLPRFRQISGPSLIPEDAFETIFKALKEDIVNQILHEIKFSSDFEVSKEILFERIFLREVRERDRTTYSKLSDTLFQNLLENKFELIKARDNLKSRDDLKSEISAFLDRSLEIYGLANIKNFIKVFNHEFYVLEPIVSVITRSTIKGDSPIGASRNQLFGEIICDRLRQIKKLLSPDSVNSATAQTSHLTNVQILVEEEPVALLQAALEEVFSSFALAIQIMEGDREKHFITSKEYEQTLLFYFLLKKFLNHLDANFHQQKENAQKEQAEKAAKRTANIFNKQELLELDPSKLNQNHPCQAVDSSNHCQTELFSTVELQVPISKSFLQLLLRSCDNHQQGKQKTYLYLPGVVDLSYWCSEIEDQGSLNTCTAFAGIALIEYFANRSFGKHTDLSPLFLYKAARNLLGVEGDVGGSIRETMKALALFGVPPEESWPYLEQNVDEEPPPFCYSYAQNYQALKYFRLDYAGIPKDKLLFQIKAMLAAGFPCMFGFTIYSSAYEDMNITNGYIPFPDAEKDRVVGGHAVVAVGYDDYKVIRCADLKTYSTGAILIRNSWGIDWGKSGYGWLPYDYILTGLTGAWWSLLKSEWFDADNFGLGARGGEDTRGGQS